MEKFDQNGSGALGQDEFVELMKYFLEQGYPDPYKQLEESFAFFETEREDFTRDLQQCDTDGSGTINISEFISLICSKEDMYRREPPPIPQDPQDDVVEEPIGTPEEERPLTGTLHASPPPPPPPEDE